MLEITKMLTISTAHISKETAEILDDADASACFPIAVYNKEGYGWWIYIPDHYKEIFVPGNYYSDIDIPDSDIPMDLHACIGLAIDNDCQWLCLDRDAAETEKLETFCWGEIGEL